MRPAFLLARGVVGRIEDDLTVYYLTIYYHLLSYFCCQGCGGSDRGRWRGVRRGGGTACVRCGERLCNRAGGPRILTTNLYLLLTMHYVLLTTHDCILRTTHLLTSPLQAVARGAPFLVCPCCVGKLAQRSKGSGEATAEGEGPPTPNPSPDSDPNTDPSPNPNPNPTQTQTQPQLQPKPQPQP